jgi:hypothetical protein
MNQLSFRRTLAPILGTLLAAFTSSTAAAQPYAIDWRTIDGGGHAAFNGGVFSLRGTSGQPDASTAFSGGAYSVQSGFWVATLPVPVAPSIGATSVSNITHDAADLGGDVTSDGGSAIVERGVVFSRTADNADPAIGGTFVTKIVVAGATGAYSTNVTPLFASTQYSVKAYATNAIGTTYSPIATFTTDAEPCPTILLSALSSSVVGQPYAGSVAATHGTAPYGYSYNGDLPLGLSLDPTTGDITGTPVVTSFTTFKVTATDSLGCSGSRKYEVAIGSVVAPSDLVIREFRLRGPAAGTIGANDEYIVVHNRTANDILVASVDSDGFSVAESSGLPVFIIPNGTVIKARGHFLGANVTNGSAVLGVAPDAAWTTDVPDTSGLGLFRSTATLDASTRIDAVGIGSSATPYLEGAAHLAPLATPGEYAWTRKAQLASVVDTNDNASDFVLVSTNGGLYDGVQSILGSPKPTSATVTDVFPGVATSLVEPLTNQNNSPNRFRTGSGNTGTLEFRRRIVNNTGATLNSIRLRMVDLTTFQSPGYAPGTAQADLRLISSSSIVVPPTSIGVTTINGLTLETVPALPIGGGWNSTVSVPVGPIPNGGYADVNIVLSISRVGNYKFLMTVEAQ